MNLICDYADVTTPFKYPVLFGADIDSSKNYFRLFKGKLSNLTVTAKYNYLEIPITLPLPSRTGYRFKGWYSDEELEHKVGNGEASYSPTDDITLYANWVEKENSGEYVADEYVHNGEYSFEENDYINTHVYLYTQENINRNFEMSFEIKDFGTSYNNATLMSATKNILKVVDPNNELIDLETYSSSNKSISNIPNTITKIKLLRINDILYYSFNDKKFLKLNNYSGYTSYSDNPVIFGADFDSDGNIYREFDGKLSNIEVRFISDDADIDDYNPQTKELEVAYEHSGDIVFDGTNYINTNIELFDLNNYDKDFEISFDVVSIATDNADQNTVLNAKYEGGTAPGMVYRVYKNKTIELKFVGGSGTAQNRRNYAGIESVKISRRNNKMYYQINDEAETQLYSFEEFIEFFNTPLTIGCSLQPSDDPSGFTPFRYFKGTLSNIVVKLEKD